MVNWSSNGSYLVRKFSVLGRSSGMGNFKPVNFFDKNPSLDVPPSTQSFNKSTLVSEMSHKQGTGEGIVNGHGEISQVNGPRTNEAVNGACH